MLWCLDSLLCYVNERELFLKIELIENPVSAKSLGVTCIVSIIVRKVGQRELTNGYFRTFDLLTCGPMGNRKLLNCPKVLWHGLARIRPVTAVERIYSSCRSCRIVRWIIESDSTFHGTIKWQLTKRSRVLFVISFTQIKSFYFIESRVAS